MAAAATSTDQTTSAVNKLGHGINSFRNSVKQKIELYDRASLATLAAATSAAAVYQKQLSTLASSAALTGQSMKSMKSGIESAFLNIPRSRGELVALATAINQLGITSAKDIGNMTSTFTKLAAVTGGSSQSLAASMLQFSNAMGDMSSRNINAMSNSLVNLSKSTGLSAQSILSFAQAIAPMAKVAGITENEVLGLSTAFTKAGADGYVAANTFNSMLQDITQLASTGNPALAKYANVLGLTVQQFNAMPRAQAVAQLFQTINSQGAQGINTLNQLGINGVRAITALQAVVSQGDLSNLAAGGSTTNNAMNRGSKAAFNNLADSLTMTRNEMTQFGTVVGTTFLGPMKAIVDVVNQLVKALGVLTPLMKAPGVLLGMAGATLSPLLGIAGPLIATHWLRRGPIGRGFGTGFGAGRRLDTTVAGSPELLAYQRMLEAQGRGSAMGRLFPGDPGMGRLQSSFFSLGAGAGSIFRRGTPGEGTDLQAMLVGLRNRGISSPLRLVSSVANAQANYARNSYLRAGFEMPRTEAIYSSLAGLGGSSLQAMLHPVATFRNFQAARTGFNAPTGPIAAAGEAQQVAMAARLAGLQRSGMSAPEAAAKATAESMEALNATIRREIKTITDKLVAEGRDIKLSQELATAMGEATQATMRLAGIQTRAAGSALASTIGALPLGRAAAGVGRFGFGLARSLVGSPLGAALTAGMVGSYALSTYRKESAQSASYSDLSLNPIQKYNEQLGIATTQLAKFGDKLDQLNAPKNVAPTTMAQAATVTPADLQTATSTKSTGLFKGVKPGNTAAALTLLQSMPITDPRQLQAIKEDMLASGFSQDQAQAVLDRYTKAGTNKVTGLGNNINYAALADATISLEGLGTGWAIGPSRSKRGAANTGDALTGLSVEQQANMQQYGPQYAGQKMLVGASTYFGGLLGGLGRATGTRSTGASAESSTTGLEYGPGGQLGKYITENGKQIFVDANDPRARAAVGSVGNGAKEAPLQEEISRGLSKLTKGGYPGYLSSLKSGKVPLSAGMNTQQQQQAFINLLQTTDEGRKWLTNNQAVSTDPAKFAQALKDSINLGTGVTNGMMRQTGFGNITMASSTVQSAIAAGQQDPKVINDAVNLMVKNAVKMGDGLQDASFQLNKFASDTGDVTGPLAQLALAAKQVVDAMITARIPQMSPAGQFQAVGGQFQAALAAPQDANYAKNLQAAQQAMSGQVQQQLQTAKSIYQTVLSYDKQISDADADMYRQRSLAQRDFGIQMQQANDDYQKQIYRATRDFGIQMQRQAQTSAQSIYNPYNQVQAQYTTDAGTLVMNLEDQNSRIAQQLQELQRARKLGVSQQAIDTLDLANPQNAQQLDDIMRTITDDPRLVKQINSLVGARLKATTSLTQNNLSMAFRNTSADFRKQMSDAATDFQIGVDRATQAQSRSLNDMATSFGISMKRSARDLNDSMKIMLADYSNIWQMMNSAVTKNLAVTAPDAANTIKSLYLDPLQRDPLLKFLLDPSKVLTELAKALKPGPGYGKDAANPGTRGDQGINSGLGASYYAVTGMPHRAAGGIATRAELGVYGEAGPEALIPLNSRGHQFMAGMYQAIAAAVAQQVPHSGGGQSVTMVDYSTKVTGNITVQANDTKQLLAELNKQNRLKRLARPPATTINSA